MISQSQKEKFAEIMSSYLGKERVCGVTDCNLLVLEMFEPEAFEKLQGRFTTPRGGARVAKKEFGYRHISDYFADNYKPVDRNFALPYDIAVLGKIDVGIYTQHGIFCVTPDNTFGFVPTHLAEFKLYRGA